MLGWIAAATAFAGGLYVNDVLVNPVDLQGMTLEKVDVRVDPNGDIRIAAPGYKIQVVNPTPMGATVAPPGPPPPATSGYYPPGAYGQPYGSTGPPPPPVPTAAGPAPLDPAIPQATWWLVTEDNASSGHSVEVWINGRLAQTVRSGETQRIIDVGAHVKRGSNEVVVKSNSTGQGGGSLYVYVGTGSDRSGTVVMDEPQVQFGVGSGRSGAAEKRYTFNVP